MREKTNVYGRIWTYIVSPMTDREIEVEIDKLLYEPWDETKCRVCGFSFTIGKCAIDRCLQSRRNGKRADDPRPHTTSDAQMREDLERLPVEKRVEFIVGLRDVLCDKVQDSIFDLAWLLLNATLLQKSLAILAAFRERNEE